MKKIKHLLFVLALVPLASQAWWSLTYRVMNGTDDAVVKFSSTDWLDWGTRVSPGQINYNTYYFPPKKMYLTLLYPNGSGFHIKTTSGCELVGLPLLRERSAPVNEIKGAPVKFGSGTVDVVIRDVSDKNRTDKSEKSIACSLVMSHQ